MIDPRPTNADAPWQDESKSTLRRYAAPLVLAIPFVIMFLATQLDFRIVGDEYFHNLTIMQFAEDWPLPDFGDYPTTSAPLPYILWTAFGKIFGFELWKLRLLSALATYLAAYLFYGLCRQLALPRPLLSALLLVFFPYSFFHGFTIYTESFGLLFSIWALRYFLRTNPNLKQLLKGSILISLAMYCRQIYVIIPIGMLVYEVSQVWRNRDGATFRAISKRLATLSLPILAIMPLLILWGGFTTPSHQASQQGDWFTQFVPQHLVFIPIFIGFYFFPAMLGSGLHHAWRKKKWAFLVSLSLLPLFFLFVPEYSEEIDLVGAATGIIAHGISMAGKVLPEVLLSILQFILWATGILLILNRILDQDWTSRKVKLLVFVAVFLGIITITPYIAERYYAVIIPFLILLLPIAARDRRWSSLWIAFMVSLSVGYSYWQIALKSFEVW